MKIMTCRELGGPCDEPLSAGSWKEMVDIMTEHVIDNHPDMAKEMEMTHDGDPEKWSREMKPKWDAAPDLDLV